MSAITKVHHGEETITSSNPTSDDIVVGLSADIAIDNCAIVATTRMNDDTGGSRAKRHALRLELGTSGSNVVITWTRHEATFADDVVLNWSVIEFDSNSLGADGIEHGTHTMGTTDASDDIALVGTFTPGNSLLFISSMTDANAYNTQADHRAVFDSTGDNIVLKRFTAPGTNDIQIAYFAVELKATDVDVEHGDSAFTNNGTQAIDPVTLADSVVYSTGATRGNSSGGRFHSAVKFNSNSQIRFDDQDLGSDVEQEITWTVIEFLTSVNVDQGEHTIADADPSDPVPLGASRTRDRTVDFQGHSWRHCGFCTDTASDTNVQSGFMTHELDGTTTSSNVVITRDASSKAFDVTYNVVELPTAAPAPSGQPAARRGSGIPGMRQVPGVW